MLLRGPNRTQVHEYNRAQIVDDVFQFARSGLMNYTRAFNILSFLRDETDYTPWAAAITGFNWVRNRLIGTPLESQINNMFIEWATPLMENLTYFAQTNETFMRSYLRNQVVPVLCRLGVEECREYALRDILYLQNMGAEVPADERNWVYCNALRYGTEADFDFLWGRFLSHNVYAEKIQILMVLGCTPHVSSLNKLLDSIVEDNYEIRRQDYTTAFSAAVSGNDYNTQIVFEYIQNNLQNISESLGTATALSYISARLRTPQQVNEFREWAINNQGALGTSFQTIYNGATTSLNALQWANEIENDIGNYFTNGGSELVLSSPAPVVDTSPVTFTVAPIVAPTTPLLPSAANTAFLSALGILFAIAANLVM